ncbi:hypothetical protein ACGF7W_19550 [Streptomyces sp. NPDC048219]|uniref:hypothetical protein n=1 Tax=Streptomyces sp. NPDC048219 TaxID=3365517 RepID=UPI003719853F
MLTSVAGRGFSWTAGDEIDLPGAEASKWADGVRAELVRTEPVETPEEPTVTETPEPSLPAVETPEPSPGIETPEQSAAETAARRPARRKPASRGK